MQETSLAIEFGSEWPCNPVEGKWILGGFWEIDVLNFKMVLSFLLTLCVDMRPETAVATLCLVWE